LHVFFNESQEPNDAEIKNKLNSIESLAVDELDEIHLDRIRESEQNQKKKLFESLCQGKANPILSRNSHTLDNLLTCQYATNQNNPFLVIGPMREELLSIDPFIAIYHDVLTKNKSEQIKSQSFNKVIKF
jgi:hypothetical protein